MPECANFTRHFCAIYGRHQQLEIVQRKTTVAAASRQFDLSRSVIVDWVAQGKAGMENALRARPEDVRERYERQLKDL